MGSKKTSNKKRDNSKIRFPTSKGPGGRVDYSGWREPFKNDFIKFDDEKKGKYLDFIREHGLISKAAKHVGVSRTTVNNHLNKDPEFEAARAQAMDEYNDSIVQHGRELVKKGFTTKKRYDAKGNLVEQTKEIPLRILEMDMRRANPDFNIDKSHTVNHTGGVMIAPPGLSAEDWIKEAEKVKETQDKDADDRK